jgi:putative peptidoglycan lipid II flippase
VTGPAAPVTRDGQHPDAQPGGPGQRTTGAGIGRAAALIGVLTVLARLLGLVRTLVFAKTVGATCLGTAYVTANTLPNIVYDIVLGGVLTSVMVPVLARPAARSGTDPGAAADVAQTSSALLTWTTLILVPVSLGLALAAGPLARLLDPVNPAQHCGHAALVAVTRPMLVVFAPQILLYGLAVVLYGILQAHRRFAPPALAPVVSSLIVIGTYLAFVPLSDGDVNRLSHLPLTAELMLAAGTTAGVAALALTAALPAWRLRVRVRPTLRFPPGVARRVGQLAVFGIVALVAEDAAQLAVILLANGRGAGAAIVLYQYGWQVFEAVYAVLAISIAVSAFPALSVRQGAEFDRTAAASLRAVLLTSFLGTAIVLAVAIPAAHFLASSDAQISELAAGFALFAPGLAGYGLVACLSRVLLADQRAAAAARCVGAGWLVVIAADVVFVTLAPARWAVGMLALGNTIGLTASAIALLAAVRRARGTAALAGTGRAALCGLAAAAAGAGAGVVATVALPPGRPLGEAMMAALAAVCATAVFVIVAFALDAGELRAAVARIRAREFR